MIELMLQNRDRKGHIHSKSSGGHQVEIRPQKVHSGDGKMRVSARFAKQDTRALQLLNAAVNVEDVIETNDLDEQHRSTDNKRKVAMKFKRTGYEAQG